MYAAAAAFVSLIESPVVCFQGLWAYVAFNELMALHVHVNCLVKCLAPVFLPVSFFGHVLSCSAW